MKWINRLYIFFVGIILSITVGFGIAAFNPEPVQPTFTNPYLDVAQPSCSANPNMQNTPDCKAAEAKQEQVRTEANLNQKAYDAAQKEYQHKSAFYNRTAIFLGIVAGAVFALIGIALIKVSKLVANGLLLGGILTAILTRALISLASLGSIATTGTGTDSFSYLEFGVLSVLSLVVIFVGLTTLKESTN